MKKILFFCALAAAGPAVAQTTAPAPAAPATAAAQVKAGATVYDTSGGQIGTIDQVNGGVVIVNTGTNKVGVPIASFGPGPNGPRLSSTKAELDAAAVQGAAQAKAQLQALLVAGTPVKGTGGTVLGTVKSANDQAVTVTTADGDVQLPASGFAAGPDGLVVGITAADLKAAVAASKAR